MRTPGNLRIDSPAWVLIQAGISYWGITTAAGAATGLTVVDSRCSTAGLQPSYTGMGLKLLGGNAAGQVRSIALYDLVTGTLTVNGNFSDFNGAIYQVPAGIHFCIGAVGALGGGGPPSPTMTKLPLPYITETWQDVLGIDFTIWDTTDILGTGAVVRTVAADVQYALLSGPAAADHARLRSVQQWQFAPDYFANPNWIYDRLTHEWEGYLGTLAGLDQANFFMGLGSAQLATRVTNDIAGFGVTGGVFQAITDDGGVETVTPLAAVTFDAWHKFKVAAWPGLVRFTVDEVLLATHVLTLPEAMMYLQYYLPQGAGGATLRIGINGIDPDPNLS